MKSFTKYLEEALVNEATMEYSKHIEAPLGGKDWDIKKISKSDSVVRKLLDLVNKKTVDNLEMSDIDGDVKMYKWKGKGTQNVYQFSVGDKAGTLVTYINLPGTNYLYVNNQEFKGVKL